MTLVNCHNCNYWAYSNCTVLHTVRVQYITIQCNPSFPRCAHSLDIQQAILSPGKTTIVYCNVLYCTVLYCIVPENSQEVCVCGGGVGGVK